MRARFLWVTCAPRGKGKEECYAMVTVLERIEGRYDVQDVAFGKVYRWRPERVVLECGCGEKPALTRLRSACPRCGADHAPAVRQELAGLLRRRLPQQHDEGARYPWRRDDGILPC